MTMSKGRRYWAKPSPGMGTASFAEDAGDHPGERSIGGWVDPPRRESSGAAEALVPPSPYDDEDATTSRRLAARGFRSISGRY
jgi:hypothetical protein